MSDILNVSPTRSELLHIRTKKKLAVKGHSLLKKKQDVLINEFFTRVKDYKKFKKGILEKVKNSYSNLSLDIAYTGIFVSRSVAYATKRQFDVEYSNENIMGVSLPKIAAERKKVDESNSYEDSPLLSLATKNYHDLFIHLINLASMEQSLRTLADEIKKIRRRVNSLEFIQIPKLEATEKHIMFVLEEQDRDNFIRLKSIKKRMEAEQ